MNKKCLNITRLHTCYIIFTLSIIFFLSSVFTFVFNAIAKEERQTNHNTQIETPTYQNKILKKLRTIETKIKNKEEVMSNEQ